jgi:hypothetical protein
VEQLCVLVPLADQDSQSCGWVSDGEQHGGGLLHVATLRDVVLLEDPLALAGGLRRQEGSLEPLKPCVWEEGEGRDGNQDTSTVSSS